VIVTRLADGRRYQVDAGTEPKWSIAGRQLYYRTGRSMMLVEVGVGSEPGSAQSCSTETFSNGDLAITTYPGTAT